MRSAAGRLFLLVLLLASIAPVASADNSPPDVGPIKAELSPPRTIYVVEASDPDGDNLSYVWEWDISCGEISFSGERAVWTHPHPPCPNEDFHPGTITVRVSDDRSAPISRVYTMGSASGVGPVDDDPRDEPPPVVFGEEVECDANDAEGIFEPSQGVWQDDEDFADAPGKQLSRHPQFERWVAELPMVKDRPTLLFGTRGDRYEIPYNVTVSGSEMAPTRVRFQVHELGTARLLNVWRWPSDGSLVLPIYGECAAAITRDLKIPVPRGAPDDALAFKFLSAGDYRIIMELVDEDDFPIPNTQVQLEGRVVDIPETKLRLVGMSFTQGLRLPREGQGPYLVPAPPKADTLDAEVMRLRREVLAYGPDYFPVARGDIVVETARAPEGIVDIPALTERCKEEGRLFDPDNPALGQFDCIASHVRAIVFAEEMRATWTSGARATVLVLPRESYDFVLSAIGLGQVVGPKLAIVIASQDHWVLLHEVAHLTPYVWDAEDHCGKNFHNNAVTYANGFRIEVGGVEHRLVRDDLPGIMTQATSGDAFDVGGTRYSQPKKWIEQCTYENLLRELQTKLDPPLQALALRILRLGANESAEILGGLTMDGEPDVLAGGEGSHAIVLRDASGRELRRYAFTPSFRADGTVERPDALVALRFERPASATKLEVVGPNGTLIARELGAQKPAVHVAAPAEHDEAVFENQTLALRYGATAGPGASLTYSVYASGDGGVTWRTLVPASNATMALVDAANFPEGEHVLRVVASDGLQSGEASVIFRMPLVAASGSGTPAWGVALAVGALAIAALTRRPE